MSEPWEEAANELAKWEPHHGQLSDGGQWFRRVGSIVERACRSYAAQQTEEFRNHHLAETCKQTKEILELREELAACRAALEAARPLVKAHLVCSTAAPTEEAEAVLDQIEKALSQ